MTSVFKTTFLLDMNTVPIQFGCFILFYFIVFKIGYSKKSIISIILFIPISLLIILNSISQVTTSMLVVFFILCLLLSLDIKVRRKIINIDRLLTYFFSFFLVICLYLNVRFLIWGGEQLHGRLVFSSTTIYTLVSLLTLVFYFKRYRVNRIQLPVFIIIAIISISTIVLTQSRGVLLTLAILILLFLLRNLSSKIIFLFIISSTVSLFFLEPLKQTGIAKRLNYKNYDTVEDFSSSRYITHIYMYDEFKRANVEQIILGHGLNSIKREIVDKQKLHFPHLDLFFVLYEGGIMALGTYIAFFVFLLISTEQKVYWLVFFLSSLHTNMILSSTIIILFFLLAIGNKLSFPKKNK